MQVSQEEGKHWSAAWSPKRRVRLGDLRHFHTLFAWRSYLELWSALYHFVCFFFGQMKVQQTEQDVAERKVSHYIPRTKLTPPLDSERDWTAIKIQQALVIVHCPFTWLQSFTKKIKVMAADNSQTYSRITGFQNSLWPLTLFLGPGNSPKPSSKKAFNSLFWSVNYILMYWTNVSITTIHLL